MIERVNTSPPSGATSQIQNSAGLVAAASTLSAATTGFGDSTVVRSISGQAQASLPADPQKERAAKIYDTSRFTYDSFLAADHPCQQELNQMLNELCKLTGIASDKLKVHVCIENTFYSNEEPIDLPTACINPYTGNIFISKSLLETLDYRSDLIKAVIAHELGHYALGHNTDNFAADGQFDPIGSKVKRFENEYSADRFATFLLALAGDHPQAMGLTLTKLEEVNNKVIKDLKIKFQTDESLWVLNSHPMSARRIRANKTLARQLNANAKPSQTLSSIATTDIKDPKTKVFQDLEGRKIKLSSSYYILDHYPQDPPDAVVSLRDIQLATMAEEASGHFPYIGWLLKEGKGNPKADEFQTNYEHLIQNERFDIAALQRMTDDDFLTLVEDLETLAKLELQTIEPNKDDDIGRPFTRPSNVDIPSFIDICTELNDLSIENAETRAALSDGFIQTTIALQMEGLFETAQMVHEDLQSIDDPNNIKLILQAVDFSQLSIDDDQNGQTVRYHNLVTMLCSRWIELQRQAAVSEVEMIRELFQIACYNRELHGQSILKSSVPLFRLIENSFTNGSDADKQAILETLQQDTVLAHGIVTMRAFRSKDKEETKYPLFSAMQTYANDKKIPFFDLQTSHSEFNNLIQSASSIREVIITKLPETKVILERVDERNPFSISEEINPNSQIPTLHVRFSTELTDSQLQEIEDKITALFKAHHFDEIPEGLNHKSTKINSVELMNQVPLSQEQIRQLFEIELPKLSPENLTQQALKLNELSKEGIVNAALATQDEDYVLIHGNEEYIRDFYGDLRHDYSKTEYIAIEKDIFTFRQLRDLWTRGFGDEYSTKPKGLEKLNFLLATQPVKLLSRDQAIVKSLAWPDLNNFEDTKIIQDQISTESNIDLLFKLRDGFYNSVLTQACQYRLDELLTEPFIPTTLSQAQLASVRTDLQPLSPELRSNQELQIILLCFNSPSYHRNEKLRPFIDLANNERDKEILSSWLTEPALTDMTKQKKAELTIADESLLDLLSRISVKDKAEALLYLIGERSFTSTNEIFIDEYPDYRSAKEPDLSALQTQGILASDSLTGKRTDAEKLVFTRPDVVVRLSKAIGISPETLLNIEEASGSRRERLEILEQIFNGPQGILSDPRAAKEFFNKIALRLVSESQSMSALPVEQQRTLTGLIAFALQEAPQEKIANLFLNIWEISKDKSTDLPSLLAKLFQASGPAFVKFGQKLATMNIPADYKSAFRNLSSGNTISDTTLFYHHLDACFGQEQNPFDSNNSGARIGEGSMATTYRAKLSPQLALPNVSSDDERAVKIIHPFIHAELDMDIGFISKLIGYINSHSADFNGLTIPNNVPEILREQLITQSDPNLEIEKAALLAEELSPELNGVNFLPIEIDTDNSKGHIITSRYRPGYELDNPILNQQGLNPQQIRNSTGLEILRQILQGSVYQSDPNLGNFGVLHDADGKPILGKKNRPQVVWYDSGAIETIAKEDQITLLKLIKAIFTQSPDLPQILLTMIKTNDSINPAILANDLANWSSQALTGKGKSLDEVKKTFEGFVDFVSKQGLEVDDKWISLSNTLSMLAPLLEGCPADHISTQVIDSMRKAKLLSATERFLLAF